MTRIDTEDAIALPRKHVSILLSRRLLVELATDTPTSWTSETERMASIYGSRATLLLRELSGEVDAWGHQLLPPEVSREGLYLVGRLLDSGQAAVLEHASGNQVDSIVVSSESWRAGPTAGVSMLCYALARSGPAFLVVQTAVA